MASSGGAAGRGSASTSSREGITTVRQVVESTNLLLQAVGKLVDCEADRGREAPPQLLHGPEHVNVNQPVSVQPDHQPVHQPGHYSRPSIQSNLSGLFNWNPRSEIGSKRRAKRTLSAAARPRSKKKKVFTWTHTFVCLADRDTDEVPDSSERAQLQLAGLGEKRFPIAVDVDANELHDELVYQYPKLKDAGGYELLRTPEGGGRDLQSIKVPEDGYTVEFLRAVVHSAKLFIRPLQKDLDLSANKDPFALTPEEACLNCGKLITFSKLREHISTCRSIGKHSDTVQEGTRHDTVREGTHHDTVREGTRHDTVRKGTRHDTVREGARHDTVREGTRHDIVREGTPVQGKGQGLRHNSPILLDSPPQCNNFDVENDSETDDALLRYTLQLSSEEVSRSGELMSSIGDVVKSLSKKMTTKEFDMIVRRSHLLQDALHRVAKPSFNPAYKIVVQFVGEDGADTGGLCREFFRLLGYYMANRYLDSTGCFQHDSVALQENVYYRLGQLVAMLFVQGGSGIHFLSHSVYNYICGMKICDIIVSLEEVADIEVKDMLSKMMEATDVEVLRCIALDHLTLLVDSGFTKPVSRIQLQDRVTLVQTVALHHVLLRSKAEIDQFCDGLQAVGVLQALQTHRDLMCGFFTRSGSPRLTADSVRKMFKVKYSPEGDNAREKEMATYMMFVDYLEDCENVSATVLSDDEEGQCNVTLPMVLSFFTGADEVPPLGFPHEPIINFNDKALLPTASTCAIQLTLPTQHHDYASFRMYMDMGMTCHGGFGLS